MTPLELRLIALLKEAREVLSSCWFTWDEDGESYNNDDVIDFTYKIDAELELHGN